MHLHDGKGHELFRVDHNSQTSNKQGEAVFETLQMELRQQEAAEARRKLGNGMSARRSLLALDQTY